MPLNQINQTYITYGSDKIYYELRFEPKKYDRITIKVKPDCHVIVFAPISATHDAITIAMHKRARWIYNKLIQFKRYNTEQVSCQYISGASHYYLGKRYVMKIMSDADSLPYVKLLRGQLRVNIQNNHQQIPLLMRAWYENKALEIFNRRLDTLLMQTYWVNYRPTINFKNMQSRWGTCSAKGRITLNTHLIKAPINCIDYVIVHELCHLAEHNHSKKFYRLLRQVSPDWEKTKDYLDERAGIYLSV